MIPALYLVCGFFYLRELFHSPESERSLIPIIFRFHILIHATLLFAEWMVMKQISRSMVIDSMGFSTLFLLWSSLRPKEPVKLMLIVWPVAFILTLLATLLPDADLLSENNIKHAQSIYLHIVLALLGYASFFLVTLTALVYLQQRYLLKRAISSPSQVYYNWVKFSNAHCGRVLSYLLYRLA